MADLYSRVSAHLLKAEAALRTQKPMSPQSINLSLLAEHTCEPYLTQLKGELAIYLDDLKPAPRKQRFYKALYTALLIVCETEDPELRAKMLVKIYAWQLANKPRTDRCAHNTVKPRSPQLCHVPSQSPQPLGRSYNLPLTERLFQHRREQMRTLRSLVRKRTEPLSSESELRWSPLPQEDSYCLAPPRKVPTLVECGHTQGLSSSPERLSSMHQLTNIRARLYHASVSIAYKTLSDGLVPPLPLATKDLPRGGEFLTSNPFLFSKKRKKARRISRL